MPDEWTLSVLDDGRIRARCVSGETQGEIMEWRNATVMVKLLLEDGQKLGRIAEVLGLREAWENS